MCKFTVHGNLYRVRNLALDIGAHTRVTGHWSEGALVRRVTGPKGHWSEGYGVGIHCREVVRIEAQQSKHSSLCKPNHNPSPSCEPKPYPNLNINRTESINPLYVL